MIRSYLFCFLVLFLSGTTVLAQESVQVRAGEHSGYSRLVFDWSEKVKYSVDSFSEDSLIVTFERYAPLDLSDTAATRLSYIRRVEQQDSPYGKTKVKLVISKGSHFRKSAIGSKIIIDVLKPEAAKPVSLAPAPPEKSPENSHKQELQQDILQKKKQEKAHETEVIEETRNHMEALHDSAGHHAEIPDPSEKDKTEEKTDAGTVNENEKTALIKEVMKEPPPLVFGPDFEKSSSDRNNFKLFHPHVITVSTTTALGVSVFVNNGYLWIVLDQSNMNIMPQISGKQKNQFKSFKTFPVTGGTVFRIELPIGAYVYTEGSGLVWRIIVTPNQRKTRPVEVQRHFVGSGKIRNGSVSWIFPHISKIVEFKDPETGEKIITVPVFTSSEFAGEAIDFVDFKVLKSPAGITIIPNSDDLSVTYENPELQVSNSDALTLIRESDIIPMRIQEDVYGDRLSAKDESRDHSMARIFNFSNWQMGGQKSYSDNQRVIMSSLSARDETGLVEGLITLAKMNMANGWGSEAVGLLNLAEQYLPDLHDSPEFLALHGAAAALSRRFDHAFDDFSLKALDGNNEAAVWRSFVLAGLEDWQQAQAAMPGNISVLTSYPPLIRISVCLGLAEVSLRAGDVNTAGQLLALVEKDSDILLPYQKHTWQYLSGESRRQQGHHDEARELWEPLSEAFDELYRAKAGLALTEMLLDDGEISVDHAIDRLERLRYFWRGDELEARINYRLGIVYIQSKKYGKGLNILRDAASIAPDSRLGRHIAGGMASIFKELFLGDKYGKIAPIEAITIYEQFPELTPTGEDGDRLVEKLAETLVEADLLDRAATILKHQIEHRLKGSEALRVSLRLAAIQLINKRPSDALSALDNASEYLLSVNEGEKKAREREIKLLRARAISQQGYPVEAINMLVEMPVDEDVNRLRADIAWRAGEWDEAAEALGQMIVDTKVSPSGQLTKKQSELILNRAVALNLADNRVALSQLRERYDAQMRATSKARIFEVLTRPRKTSVLADRETLMHVVSEVDMFKAFLDNYKGNTK